VIRIAPESELIVNWAGKILYYRIKPGAQWPLYHDVTGKHLNELMSPKDAYVCWHSVQLSIKHQTEIHLVIDVIVMGKTACIHATITPRNQPDTAHVVVGPWKRTESWASQIPANCEK